MKPTLLVLAAGMGSRYGGLKQLDGLGPHGETIMDYSIYDAMQSGFGKVVFVFLSMSCSRQSTTCPKASYVLKAEASPGVRTTQ